MNGPRPETPRARKACGLTFHLPTSPCPAAIVRAWRVRDVQRLHTRILDTTEDARDALYEILGPELAARTHMIAIGLGARNDIVAVSDAISPHTLPTVCAFRPAELLGLLYREGDPSRVKRVLLGHNHLRNCTPELCDLRITDAIAQAFVGMDIIDHVIVAPSTCTSIREENPDLFPATWTPVLALSETG